MNDQNNVNQQNENQDADSDKIFLTENSTLQTPEEDETDKNRGASEADEGIITNTIQDADIDDVAGSDRAGTSERKRQG